MADEEAGQGDVRRQPEPHPRPESGQNLPVEQRVAAERGGLGHDRRGQEGRAGVPQAGGVARQPAQPRQQAEDAHGQRHEQHAVHDPAHALASPAPVPRRRPVRTRIRRGVSQ